MEEQAKETKQFDFWIGEWTLTWPEEGGGRGSNQIQKQLDEKVIVESFDGDPSDNFKGMSVSVYDVKSEQWKQTWVDNQGAYLDFTGGFHEGKMILSREAKSKEKIIHQRMVWFNIQENELDWHWESSQDGGQTWKALWKIHYQRKQ